MHKKHQYRISNPIVNKHKHNAKIRRNMALQWLSKRFPEAFDNHARIRPLKVGILQDVLSFSDEAEQAGFSKTKLRAAVVLFARRVDYLSCLKTHEKRIDLFGNSVSSVTEEEAIKAKHKIKKRIEKAIKHVRQQQFQNRIQSSYYNSTTRHRPAITIKPRSRLLDPNIVKKLEKELDL